MDQYTPELNRNELKQKMKNKLNQSQKSRSTAHAKAFAELKHDKWTEQQKENQDSTKDDTEN